MFDMQTCFTPLVQIKRATSEITGNSQFTAAYSLNKLQFRDTFTAMDYELQQNLAYLDKLNRLGMVYDLTIGLVFTGFISQLCEFNTLQQYHTFVDRFIVVL